MGIIRKLGLGALAAALAAAEPLEDADKTKRKREPGATVTVTAEATPVEAEKTPNPVRILDAAAIQARAPRTLADLLPDLAPGQALPYGGPGAAASLYLGGARARDVVVLLDGIRITDAAGLSPDFGTLGLAAVARAELLRGPASTLYGADAHGGVVALSSAGEAPAGFSGRALFGRGNRDTWQGDLATAFGWDGGWARLHLGGAKAEAAIPSDREFRSAETAFSAGQRLGEDGQATLLYRNRTQGTPLPFTGDFLPPSYAFAPVFDASREARLRSEQLIGSLRTLLSPVLFVEASLGQDLQARREPGEDRYRSQRNQAVATLTWAPVPAYSGTWKLDLSAERAAILRDRAETRHLALATEHGYSWGEALRAVVSLRIQRDRLDYGMADGTTLPERARGQAVWKAGLNWRRGGWRLYGGYGTSWNTPDLYALVHNLAGGHGDLDDEKSHGLQLGGDYTRGPWRLRLEASRTWYDQVVNFVWLPGYAYKYENGTRLRVQGLETALGLAREDVQVELFARVQEARNGSVPAPQQLRSGGALGRPFFIGGLRAEGRRGPWRGALAWTRIGSSYQYFDQPGGVDGLRTHVNSLGLDLARRFGAWELALRGSNLLQRAWSREDWLAGRIQGRNDAYLVPVFPLPPPTISLLARVRF